MTKILLDLSPVHSNPLLHTGLAREALNLALQLKKIPNISVSCCAWGSVAASADFECFLKGQTCLQGLEYKPSCLEKFYLSGCNSQKRSFYSSLPGWRQFGQALNLLRTPVSPADLKTFDLVHSTYARFPRVVRKYAKHRVITLHDINALKLPPEWVPPGQAAITRRIVDSIQPDDWVVCISDYTRKDFLEYKAHPSERCLVNLDGVALDTFQPVEDPEIILKIREKFNLADRPFFYTLSSLAPHKNLKVLFSVWPEVIRNFPEALLVISGGKNATPSELQREFHLSDQDLASIRLTGFVTDEDFAALASCCQRFLFPSLYEGFGLPVLEAMACGAPVICSNRTSLPEVVGDTGLLIDPEDENAWKLALMRELEPPLRTNVSIDHLERAQAFAWSKTAQGFASIYAEICAGA